MKTSPALVFFVFFTESFEGGSGLGWSHFLRLFFQTVFQKIGRSNQDKWHNRSKLLDMNHRIESFYLLAPFLLLFLYNRWMEVKEWKYLLFFCRFLC